MVGRRTRKGSRLTATVRVTLPLEVGHSEGSAEGSGAAGAGVSAGVAAEAVGDPGCQPDWIGNTEYRATQSGAEKRHEVWNDDD